MEEKEGRRRRAASTQVDLLKVDHRVLTYYGTYGRLRLSLSSSLSLNGAFPKLIGLRCMDEVAPREPECLELYCLN